MEAYKKTILLISSLIILACDGTSVGNPVVDISFDSYNNALSAKVSPLSVNSVTMCFKRLRFKMDALDDDENIDVLIGEIAISSSGTELNSIRVPKGTYTRVEFDLENDCEGGTGYSLIVDNTSGTFQTTDRMTIRFDGTFTVGNNNAELILGIQTIISALNTVTDSNDIKTAVEGVSGDF